MTRSKFEKYASSKITQHQSSIDTEALWQAVAPEAPQKKRRGIFWYFLSGLLVTSLVSATFYGVTNTSDSGSGSLAEINQEEGLRSTAALSKDAASSTYPIDEDHTSPQETNSVLTNENNIANDQKETGLSNEVGNSIKQKQPLESKLSFSETSPNELSFNSSTKSVGHEANTGNTIENDDVQLSYDANNSALPIKSIGLVDVSLQEYEANRINNSPTLSLSVAPKLPDNNQPLPKPNPSSKHKILYFIGAYGGVSATSSSLTAKYSSSSEYLNVRNQTEKQLETFQFGIEFGADVFKGLTIKTGIEVSRIARVFTFNDEVIVVDSIYGLKEIFVNNQTQDTINVYGQVPVITTTEYQKKTYNNISQIDIPIKIGYAFRSESWRFGLDVGTIINLNTSYTGEILAPDATFYDLKSDPESWFKTNTGIAFTAGLSVGHTLGSSFEVYLAPLYRSASIFSTDANPIEQAHARFGANLGFRYLLGQ